MKIRNGFVSNSSSSSFLIYGVEITQEYMDLIKTKLNIVDEDTDDDNEDFDYEYDDGLGYEYVERILKGNKDLYIYSCCDGEYIYIGKSWDLVGDDQTGKQFKDSIKESIKTVLGLEEISCGTHEGDS